MMKHKPFLYFVLLFLTVGFVYAVPADPTPITVKQPHGKNLTLIQHGTEKISWAVTLDGYTLLRGENQAWVYAKQNAAGEIEPSAVYASNVEERSESENHFLTTIPQRLFFTDLQFAKWSEESEIVHGDEHEHHASMQYKSYPTTGTAKLLVILVDFTDLPFTYTQTNFQNLVSQTGYSANGATGSVKDYYYENSKGQFTMDIDVVGPVHLSHTLAYYGGNNAYRKDARVRELVQEALRLADPLANYSLYDNDGDGVVDAFHIIYAGTPESSTSNPDEIWPHRSEVYNAGFYDNKGFRIYSISSEKKSVNSMVGIGTICHEFGHVLGLPDWYDTDYAGSGGISVEVGQWSLMSSGPYLNDGNTPPYMSGVEREMLNWHQHTTLNAQIENAHLYPIQDSNKSYVIDIKPNHEEMFVLEYRSRNGWDTYLPTSGLLIYHVDRSVNNWYVGWTTSGRGDNSLNADPSNRGYFLVPANNVLTSIDNAGAAFPGSSNIINFTAQTQPATQSKAGVLLNTPITNIRQLNDSVVLFNYKSNRPEVATKSIIPNSVRAQSVVIDGVILHDGNLPTLHRGFVCHRYADSADFLHGQVVHSTSTTTIFQDTIRNLTPNTTYYVRSFAIARTDTVYGNFILFTTSNGLGVITTGNATNITRSEAVLNASLANIGEGTFVSKGFCYSKDETSTLSIIDAQVVRSNQSDLGNFNLTATGLEECEKYYYRPFIETSFGIRYGAKRNFITEYTPINNNNISTNQDLCGPVLPSRIDGTTAGGGKGVLTYTWQQKQGNAGWNTAAGTAQNTHFQPDSLRSTTLYRRIAISNGVVFDTSNTITITVKESKGGTITNQSTAPVAPNSSLNILKLRGYQGSILAWEQKTETGTWETINNSQGKTTPDGTVGETEGTFLYRVKVQDGNCPSSYSNEATVIVANSSAIDLAAADQINIALYPNPTQGLIYLSLKYGKTGSIIVTDLTGKDVYRRPASPLNKTLIDLSFLPSGVYLLNVYTADSHLTKQLIIQR